MIVVVTVSHKAETASHVLTVAISGQLIDSTRYMKSDQ